MLEKRDVLKMIKFILILTFIFLSTKSFASVKGKIINNLDKIDNLSLILNKISMENQKKEAAF